MEVRQFADGCDVEQALLVREVEVRGGRDGGDYLQLTLGDRTGMYNDPHTGVALAVLIKLVKSKQIDRSQRVVVISTANGLKFTDFKVGYHDGTLGFQGAHRNQPLELAPSDEAVKAALHQRASLAKGRRGKPEAAR